MNFGRGTAQFRAPKTILGFFAIMVAILATAAVGAISVLARISQLQSYVAPILIFVALIIVLVLIGVFITAWKDPTILMLGQVSGEVYVEFHKQRLGDSTSGEYSEKVLLPASDPTRVVVDKPEDSPGESHQ